MQIGFAGLLTIVFVALKLTNIPPVSQWEWVWVLSPLWISFLLWLFFILVTLVIGWLSISRGGKKNNRW